MSTAAGKLLRDSAPILRLCNKAVICASYQFADFDGLLASREQAVQGIKVSLKQTADQVGLLVR